MIIDLGIMWSFLNEYVGYIILFALGIFMYNEFRTNVSNLKSSHEDNLSSGYFPKLGMMGTTFGLILVFLNFLSIVVRIASWPNESHSSTFLLLDFISIFFEVLRQTFINLNISTTSFVFVILLT